MSSSNPFRVSQTLWWTFFVVALTLATVAQERVGSYQVRVVPSKPGWTYELDEPAKFLISVSLDGHPRAGIALNYSCGPESFPATVSKTITTTAETTLVDAGTMKTSGFLRCVATAEVERRSYRGIGTAGFRPDLLKATTTIPADFDAFWQQGRSDLAKVPLEPKVDLIPSYSTPKVNVYHVSFQNVGAVAGRVSRIYGILAVPKGSGPFPAVLHVPGAGVRPYRGSMALAERGIITLQIGIHGIPVNLDQSVYDDLANGALNRYMFYGMEDKSSYYYRRVVLGCLRANDFLQTLPEFDGKNLAVMGGSQGGALSVMTAALDNRVKGLAVWIPAMADQTAYLSGRAGGWPHALKDKPARSTTWVETSRYYDTANFARRLKVPVIYTFGFNDETCPPTSMYATYNEITAPKTLILAAETGHAITSEQSAKINHWVEKLLSPTEQMKSGSKPDGGYESTLAVGP
jgi:cephalosporin-C deacetylase